MDPVDSGQDPTTGTDSGPTMTADSGTLPGSTGPGDDTSDGTGGESTTTGVDDDGTSTGEDGSSSDSSTTMSDEESTGEPALSVEDMVPGDLVITEVMSNPHCNGDACEWVEILNATDEIVNLLDLYIQDNDYSSANQGRVTEDIFLGPGEMAVIARDDAGWPYDFMADAIYGPNPGISNGSPDRVVLLNSTEIIDETPTFFDGEQGVAWSLSASATDAVSNDDSSNWCGAVAELPAGFYTEYGSPFVANPDCPP